MEPVPNYGAPLQIHVVWKCHFQIECSSSVLKLYRHWCSVSSADNAIPSYIASLKDNDT